MKKQNKTELTLKTSTSTKISVFALILLLATSLMMALAQVSFAQIGVPQPEETSGFISVAPTLIGVGQTATVNLFVYPIPTGYHYAAYFGGFNGITVTFTKPDGTKDSFMPVDGTGQYDPGQTEATGSLYIFYVPDMVGDWSVTMSMPAQNVTDSTGTVQYLGCTSEPAYFTVTEEEQLAGLLNGYPWAELPNENTYWDYPISSNNREWYAISGEWLQGGAITAFSVIHGTTSNLWQPYGSAPNTAHIVWDQPIKAGGLIGGDYGSLSYTTAFSTASNIIMQGKVFSNRAPSLLGSDIKKFICTDLTTGEVLYEADGWIDCGIHLPGNPFAQSFIDESVVLASSFGSIPTAYLFGTSSGSSGVTWNYYDPETGKLIRSISNAPSTTMSLGTYQIVDGTNFAYGMDGINIFAWDVSKVVSNNWTTGIIWTIPLPESNTGITPSVFGLSTDISTLVVRSNPNQYWGYSTEDGTLVWGPLTLSYPALRNEQMTLYGVDDFVVFDATYSTFHCYSMLTGDELWVSDSYDSTWGSTWTVYNSWTNDYENLYLMFPDGTMSALSLATGQEVWSSEPIASTEYPNNVVPYVTGIIMVGGNIYAYAGYSILYHVNPIPRLAMMVCVDAATGDIKYTLNGGVYPSAAANGYVIGFGQYDGNIYCIGKGQTSTSVTIQDNVVANGDTVLITGNVLDESPAQAGTPAVSDADMSEWMDYIHMQNASLLNNPPTPDGVPVKLFVVNPDGTEEWITTVTSDSYGNYAYMYVPSTEGVYKVIAKFDGSESYWPSSAETSFGVTPAVAAGGTIEPEQPTPEQPSPEQPTTTEPIPEQPTPEEPEPEPTETPLITTEVAIEIAVVAACIIGALAYLAIRKRK